MKVHSWPGIGAEATAPSPFSLPIERAVRELSIGVVQDSAYADSVVLLPTFDGEHAEESQKKDAAGEEHEIASLHEMCFPFRRE